MKQTVELLNEVAESHKAFWRGREGGRGGNVL